MSQPHRAPLRILQLTDLHLHARPDTRLNWGLPGSIVSTDATLERVLSDIAADPKRPDLMLLTGDLAQEPVARTYRRLDALFAPLGCPTYALPGNHDDADLLYAELRGPTVSSPRVVALGDWVCILLDSTVAGESGGRLDETELALLEETLERHPAAHALVALHHPPLPLGSPWLDGIGLTQAAALHAVFERYPHVRGVLFGHAHQEFDSRHQGVRYLGTPATCIQFVPRAERLAVDALGPAYRWLELHANGHIETGVHYVDAALLKRA